MIDILVCMFSAYYDEEGALVKDVKIVSLSYIKSWFFIDIIACIPWDLILYGSALTSGNFYFYNTKIYYKLHKFYLNFRIFLIQN